jgi:hypothetical protein
MNIVHFAKFAYAVDVAEKIHHQTFIGRERRKNRAQIAAASLPFTVRGFRFPAARGRQR